MLLISIITYFIISQVKLLMLVMVLFIMLLVLGHIQINLINQFIEALFIAGVEFIIIMLVIT